MDISFGKGDMVFTERVAAIILSGGKALLETSAEVDFWTLPGGRVELMETSMDALRRELREELGLEVLVARPVWVVEMFYSCKYKRHHEITFYYVVDLPANSASIREYGPMWRPDKPGEPAKLTFAWHDISDLQHISLYPEFLRDGLANLPEGLEHMVHVDGVRA